jgi:phosphopantetheinyl transferase
MPLVYQQNINDHTKIGVWHITEPETYFLTEVSLQGEIKNPNKRVQFLAGRFLLKQLDKRFSVNDVKISNSKKPYLIDGQFHFSVSHSGNYAAAIISERNNAGIDIELPQHKIKSIKHKFVNDSELLIMSTLPMDDYYQHTLVWCIKEAVFKWYGQGQVDFIKHICIESIAEFDNHFQADVVFKKSTDILLIAHAIFFEGYCLVWVM